MKKLILSALLLAFTSIFVVGCNDSDSPSYAPIDLNDPLTLAGTYDITFYGTYDYKLAVTNDCAKFSTYFEQPCDPKSNQTSMRGEAVVKIGRTDNAGTLITKIQMAEEGPFGKYGLAIQHGRGNEIYNYTEYNPIYEVDPTSKTINESKTVSGTTGRNLDSKVLTDDDYVLRLQDDGSLLVKMDKKDVNGIVIIIMQKRSDYIVDLNPNEPYPTPAISGFVKNIQ